MVNVRVIGMKDQCSRHIRATWSVVPSLGYLACICFGLEEDHVYAFCYSGSDSLEGTYLLDRDDRSAATKRPFGLNAIC